MKGLGFAGTQESCFEAWKRSHMCCAALLCGRFADVQELHFKHEKVKIWAVPHCKGVHLRIVSNGIFRLRNVQIRGNKLMSMNRVLSLRNVQIWLVPSC